MKKKHNISDFKHIAIIQTAFIGDVALALPLTQAIRNINPDAEISFVTTPVSSSLISCVKAINHVISYDKRGLQEGMRGIRSIVDNLKERRVDCIIAPHRSLRTTLISFLSKPRLSIGFNKNSLSILYKKRVKYRKHWHELDRNLSLLSVFSEANNIKVELPEIELDISEHDKSYIESRLNWCHIQQGDKIVVIAPGSIWETKKWKKEYFARLALMLDNEGLKPVFIGSAQDKELCSEIINQSTGFNFAGETTIPQLFHLLKLASLTVTNDSAPTHLAGLAGCPTLTIFGPTSPIFGFPPRGQNDRILELADLKCHPCAIHGSKECPVKTHVCMTGITPEMVFKESLEIIELSKK